MQMTKKQREEENTGIHMERIIAAVPCFKHGADTGDACWNLGSALGILKAICDRRARSAGCNGQVTLEARPAPSNYKAKEYK